MCVGKPLNPDPLEMPWTMSRALFPGRVGWLEWLFSPDVLWLLLGCRIQSIDVVMVTIVSYIGILSGFLVFTTVVYLGLLKVKLI